MLNILCVILSGYVKKVDMKRKGISCPYLGSIHKNFIVCMQIFQDTRKLKSETVLILSTLGRS